MFDPGGCLGRLRGCSSMGGRHALLHGEVRLDAVMVSEFGAFFYMRRTSTSLSRK